MLQKKVNIEVIISLQSGKTGCVRIKKARTVVRAVGGCSVLAP